MKAAISLLAITFAAAALPALGQDAEDLVRLDEFAIPRSGDTPQIEQLSAEAADPLLAPQEFDRTLGRPAATEARGAMPAQLSQGSGSGQPTQLSDAADSRSSVSNAVSSTADSNPGAVVRLQGRDRCDPQVVQRVYAECLRILELRADEFNAPEPPRLSAEQTLLAEQRQRDEELSRTSSTLRLRLATMSEPDADLQSNQELASIYLDTAPQPSSARPEEPAAEVGADLGEILQGLGLPPGAAPPE